MAGSASQSSKRQIILTGVLILVLLGGGIYWYSGSSGSGVVVELPPDAPDAGIAQSGEARRITNAIDLLQRTNLDTEFFNDEKFASLRLTPVSIPPVQPRRQSVLKFIEGTKSKR